MNKNQAPQVLPQVRNSKLRMKSRTKAITNKTMILEEDDIMTTITKTMDIIRAVEVVAEAVAAITTILPEETHLGAEVEAGEIMEAVAVITVVDGVIIVEGVVIMAVDVGVMDGVGDEEVTMIPTMTNLITTSKSSPMHQVRDE